MALSDSDRERLIHALLMAQSRAAAHAADDPIASELYEELGDRIRQLMALRPAPEPRILHFVTLGSA